MIVFSTLGLQEHGRECDLRRLRPIQRFVMIIYRHDERLLLTRQQRLARAVSAIHGGIRVTLGFGAGLRLVAEPRR